LLLRSANDKHPNGLANNSGVVGRHYMRHNNAAFLAISKQANPTVFQKTLALLISTSAPMIGTTRSVISRCSANPTARCSRARRRIGLFWKPEMSFDVMARHSIDFWLTSEDLPDPENRVMLDSDGKVVLHLTENNMEGHRRLMAKLKEMLRTLDCHPHLLPRSLYLGKNIPIGGTAHQCGTIRFGRDPRRSALDINCKAHDLDNLYVVDGSFFVSSGAVNPALTIMANALRVAQHLGQRLR